MANLSFQDAVAHPLRSGGEGHSLPPNVLHSINKDAAFNGFSGDATSGFTVVLPKFTKQLSAIRTRILLDADTHAECCAFDLAGRLGLLPGQSNEMLGQFETVTMNDLVHNGTTYCARISRHYLVLLISEHVQELWQVDNRTYASTNIGQFTFYEYEGRSLVHFDGSIRTSTTTIIPDQVIEDIQRAACGEYRSETGGLSKRPPENLVVDSTPILDVIHYLRQSDIERWCLLRKFASSLMDAVQSIVRAQSPESLIMALKTDWIAAGVDSWSRGTATDRLAANLQVSLNFHNRHIRDVRDRGESG